MRLWMLAIVSALVLGCGQTGNEGASSMEDLVSRYVAAVNQDDAPALEALHAPSVREKIDQTNRAFFEDIFTRALERTIPAKREIAFEAVQPGATLPFEGMLDYVVRPSHQITLDYDLSEHSAVQITLGAIEKDGGWFLVLPIPTEESLVAFERGRAQRREHEARLEDLLDSMDADLRREVVEKLEERDLFGAIEILEARTDLDKTMAVTVAKEIRRREGLE